MHALGVAGLWLAGLPVVLKWLCTLVAVMHFALRRPEDAPGVVLRADGTWDVPARGLKSLRLGPRTRYTGLWVELELIGGAGSRVDILLLADQLDAAQWSRFQASLRHIRRPSNVTASSS